MLHIILSTIFFYKSNGSTIEFMDSYRFYTNSIVDLHIHYMKMVDRMIFIIIFFKSPINIHTIYI
jgi:hypothetical protein